MFNGFPRNSPLWAASAASKSSQNRPVIVQKVILDGHCCVIEKWVAPEPGSMATPLTVGLASITAGPVTGGSCPSKSIIACTIRTLFDLPALIVAVSMVVRVQPGKLTLDFDAKTAVVPGDVLPSASATGI